MLKFTIYPSMWLIVRLFYLCAVSLAYALRAYIKGFVLNKKPPEYHFQTVF